MARRFGFGSLERPQESSFVDLLLLLGVLERGLAILEQLGSSLVGDQGFLKRNLPAFHCGDDGLQFRVSGFEACGNSVRGGHVSERPWGTARNGRLSGSKPPLSAAIGSAVDGAAV